jgi:hypothetical protein
MGSNTVIIMDIYELCISLFHLHSCYTTTCITGITYLVYWLELCYQFSIYGGESVNSSQMAVQCKSYVIKTWTILLSIPSPSFAHRNRCCKDRSIQSIFFFDPRTLGTHCAHTFCNFKQSCIMLCPTMGHPSTVATLSVIILLSA